MPHGIILLGANGSGKSTLGRELARALNFAHFDVEDYWFYKTFIPYTTTRPQKERNEMLRFRYEETRLIRGIRRYFRLGR